MFSSAKFKEWQEKIDARVLRERVLIFLSVLAVLFFIWDFLIQSSISKDAGEARAQLTSLTKDGANLQVEIANLTQQLMNDPDKSKKGQVASLQTDIDAVETNLQHASQGLIKANELPKALEDVLQKTTQLTLLEVTTLPAEELQLKDFANSTAVQSGSLEKSAAGIFSHHVVLKMSGNYFQVIQFLNALEALPWRFYWRSLNYEVTEYPSANVTLDVYTLSSEEGLLGV